MFQHVVKTHPRGVETVAAPQSACYRVDVQCWFVRPGLLMVTVQFYYSNSPAERLEQFFNSDCDPVVPSSLSSTCVDVFPNSSNYIRQLETKVRILEDDNKQVLSQMEAGFPNLWALDHQWAMKQPLVVEAGFLNLWALDHKWAMRQPLVVRGP
ncbi:hypothetical protein NFI96_002503 [Prochilodus magdalenae]|nr:hypothetical protein NFI96_002503 [Prochilodus magdalenae]